MQSQEGMESVVTSADGSGSGAMTLSDKKTRRAVRKAEKLSQQQSDRKRHGFKLFLLISPFLILSVLFSYLPLFGWVYAFYDYQPPIPLSQSEFVGLQWFKMMVQNPAQLQTIGQVLINTFAMSGLNILTSFFPLFFAIALNEIRAKWFRNLIQTLTTLPNFISWVLVYAVAFAMFSTTGMLNEMLQNLHIISEPIKFLDSDSHTWLKMLLSNFLNNGMDQYFVFQNAFNTKHIQVLDLYVYNVGMGNNSLSYATAISMLKSLVSVGLLIVVNWLSKRTRGVSIV